MPHHPSVTVNHTISGAKMNIRRIHTMLSPAAKPKAEAMSFQPSRMIQRQRRFGSGLSRSTMSWV